MKKKRGKNLKKSRKVTKITFEDRIKKPVTESSKEKIILLLFLIFVILALIIMFKPQQFSKQLLGAATSTVELEKIQFNANEKLQGKVIFTLHQEDILPNNSIMGFFIISNASKISTQYVCPNGKTVPWKNATDIIDPDPEGTCCLISGKNCTQIVLNSGFDADFDSPKGRWQKIAINASREQISIYDDFQVADDENPVYSRVAVLDSSPAEGKSSAFVSLRQFFTGSRAIKISDLTQIVPPPGPSGNESGAGGISGGAIVVPPGYYTLRVRVIDGGRVEIKASSPGTCTGDCTVYYLANSTGSFTGSSFFCNSTCNLFFAQDTIVNLTARPISGAKFMWWTEDCSSAEINPNCTIRMNSNKNVTAVFVPLSQTPPPTPYSTLIVQVRGDGAVGVEVNGSGFSCTSNCTASYPQNTTVKLTAIPLGGSFSGWGGACSGTNPNCAIIMDSDKSVYASFTMRQGMDSLYYDVAYEGESPCAFEIVVRGKNSTNASRALHYFYSFNEACRAFCQSNDTNKCIPQSFENPDIGLASLKQNLYKDWTSSFPNSADDTLTAIELISYSKVIEQTVYSQVVYFDNVKIAKPSFSLERCEQVNKKCCLPGTGYGNYYGEQLNCTEGKECWSKCTNPTVMTLKDFISKSNQNQKYNKTSGLCQAIVDGEIVGLNDYCENGYTACLDTSNTSPRMSCRNWNNAYEVNLSKLNLKVPDENGTYEFLWEYTYVPEQYSEGGEGEGPNAIVIFTKSVPFTVGTISGGPGSGGVQESWTCDAWSSCQEGLQYANCTETNTGRHELKNRTCCWSCTEWQPAECPENLMQTRTCVESTTMDCPEQNATKPPETRSCTPSVPAEACTEEDWECSEWSKCTGGKRYRHCEKINDCREDTPSSYVPLTEEPCRGTIFKGFLLYGVIIIVAAAVAIVLFLKFFRKPTIKPELKIKKTKEVRYPEVVSYIKEATAAGASRKEIEAKLLEAGWPKDIIDESFEAAA